MNDSSELSYAHQTIIKYGRRFLESLNDDNCKEIGLAALASFERGSIQDDPFIACFCEKDDLLSQWRGYGPENGSASLGLDLVSIYDSASKPGHPSIVKVIYNRTDQRTQLELALGRAADVILRLRSQGWDDGSRLTKLSEFAFQN
ncbi:hypothetical protein, partial [Arthrobacter agilis]|uniref:hypothetical protein n=1 Tax=Arthrobacter agilis TaxID=37921 RepID=UPI001ABF9835